MDKSTARQCLVSAPTETKCTPVSAIATKSFSDSIPTGRLELYRCRHLFCCRAHIRQGEIIKHNPVGFGSDGLIEFEQIFDLDLDLDAWV